MVSSIILLHLRMRRLLFGSWHFGQDAAHFFLLVKGFPEVVQVQEILGNLLNLLHVDMELGKPRSAVLVEDDASHVQTGQGYQVGWEEQGDVRSQAVADNPKKYMF